MYVIFLKWKCGKKADESFLHVWYVWCCVSLCVYKVCAHVYADALTGSQRRTLCVLPLLLIHVFPWWNLSLNAKLWFLRARWFSYLCSPQDLGYVDVHGYSQLFMWVLGDWTRKVSGSLESPCLWQELLSTELSPQLRYIFSVKLK